MNHNYSRFFSMLANEIQEAAENYPPMNSLHEGYAVILEELDEVKGEVWKKPAHRDPGQILRELIQTAAMCARTAVDCGLVAPEEPKDVEVPRGKAVPAVGRGYKYALWMDAS